MSRRVVLSLALAAAVLTLAGTVAATVAHHGTAARYGGYGMMGGAGAMAGGVWLAGNGTAVRSIAAARARAAVAAPSGLRPGEVIWFDNGFYVELKDPAGNPATEVLVDPSTGAVATEPGPAMMWNTSYGRHGGAPDPAVTVSTGQARQIADRWLAAHRPGSRAGAPDGYPGYYTVETSRAGTVDGMLSVNARTGEVWYHTWHGRFIAREDG